ncbi:exo-beta-N-acetylmuramidase NamZ domain-containing protein [Mucilaginibacter litoreus]|uniref:Exo-beta-N-acetylmuramidase NamZ domain-containing protein n=1 Tax=Mucilaginibacter litoreus TaxID=1048221 RepID=A0ABW3APT4_9SPHI
MTSIRLNTMIMAAAMLLFSCDNFAQNKQQAGDSTTIKQTTVKRVTNPILPAADRTELYLDYLKGRKVGMLINQTSVIGPNKVPVVDSLLKLGVKVKKIFGPEHGFRGNASNGATIGNTTDPVTGLPAISLYGKHFKPTPEDLKGIDLMIFDVQDVGTRFYTYISTLHYVMEACAENNIELLILDRPNPNGIYVDGPVLDTAFRSFVGMHPIPVTHGMTIGEYAQMINGEGWLKNKVQCKLKIVKVGNYSRDMAYELPVNPSPNLNTQQSILLYPHICFFEGTKLSLGRGTLFPFQVIGSPLLKGRYEFNFKPVSIPGMSENPPLKDTVCYGLDLKNYNMQTIRSSGKLNLAWLIDLYKVYPDKAHFFNAYFKKLAGTDELRKQIIAGKTEAEIRQSWEPALTKFKAIRGKYLLYN